MSISIPPILPDKPGDRPGQGGGPPRLGSLHRQIEAMEGRIGSLGSGPNPDSAESLQALEATMEKLRVAVEELRRTNETLVDSRAEVEAERRRYRDLFDLGPDAYLVTDLRGSVREANRAALTQLNINPSFLIGRPFLVFLPLEDRQAFRSELSRLRDEMATSAFDFRLKPRNLPSFDASVRVGVVRDALGRAVALHWTFRDISARKQAQAEIKALNEQLQGLVVERSEQLDSVLQTNERWLIKAHAADQEDAGGQFFRDIVEEVDAIFWRADAETGRYAFVSRRAEELLGYPPSRWVDDPDFWLKSMHPEDRDFAAAYRRKQVRAGLDHESEYRVVAADGRNLWFREAVRILPPKKAGAPATLYGLMVNISKRKKVERQLYTAKGELASQLRDMSYLHELAGRLATARGLSATFDEVLSAVASLQGADLAMLWLLEPGEPEDDRRPTLAASFGLPDDFAGWADRAEFASKAKPVEPLAIEDVEAQPEGSPWREAGRFAGFRAAAVVPLFNGEGELVGSIVTAFKAAYRMGERQARLVEMYAGQAAEAIEAARAFDRLERADGRKSEALAAMETRLAELLAAREPNPIHL